MKAFQASLAKLEGADTQVLGVSVDSPFSNHAFATQNGITFPLLGESNLIALLDEGNVDEFRRRLDEKKRERRKQMYARVISGD